MIRKNTSIAAAPENDSGNEPDGGKDKFGFEPTLWTSVIGPAGASDEAIRFEALERLLETYQSPLKAFLRAALAKYRPDQDWIDDCFQAFVLEKIMLANIIKRADRQKGRFRDLLKTSIRNFAVDKFRQSHNHRKGTELKDEHQQPAAACANPVEDVGWAREIMRQALETMRTECRKKKQDDLWAVFKRRRLRTLRDGSEIESLVATADALKRKFGVTLMIQKVSNLQSSGDRKLRRHVRNVLSEYCRNKEEIDHELETFIRCFAATGSLLPGSQATDTPTTTFNTRGFMNDLKPTVSSLNSSALATLFHLGRQTNPRSPEALQESLDHLLTIPFENAVNQLPMELAKRLRQHAASLGLVKHAPETGISTFGDLLRHPQPPIEMLKFAKEFGKAAIVHGKTEWPKRVCEVLYYGSYAAGLARRGKQIGKLSKSDLQEGLTKIAGRAWIGREIRILCEQAAAQLTNAD
jgi:DNA-directed RNA polymerase specialized sigma24 family protein